ncbi:hypothetical protein EPA93_34200 [Ktedonosporobacter rubrisoli]|uniref:Blue (type 1) copper domain-containing protein n=2 Tax=Ktedonosporobacter rubrisoli TaxID=2509675 RepID=A0A4P6K6L3_KTERU|nr:hypothetical protein EPA93_34200 [Ktedonosporobacter rubrisoli]
MAVTVLLAACGGSSTEGPNQVHMSDARFVQEVVTIPKGAMLTLVNDAPVIHIIKNGTWDQSGTPRPAKEQGAPAVDVSVTANGSQQIGPFNTAGTFQLYCVPHPGMKLSVVVH